MSTDTDTGTGTMNTATDTDTGIRVVPFEAAQQAAVAAMFKAGLVDSYAHKSQTIQLCQQKFVALKLSPDEGDMFDINKSFMCTGDDRFHFWVAVDASGRVLGHVGAIPPTYATDTPNLYDESAGITPATVLELVRMSVHKDARGKGVGQKLCTVVEEYAAAKGMKKVVLSTLKQMDLACALYKKCGYEPLMDTPIDTAAWLGEGQWEPLVVAHFSKNVSN
jgi:ribosomal protein S18 acetylase RimI-like enzyme